MGNYCRAKDFSQIGNVHFSVWALSHSKQKSIQLEDLFLHLNTDQNVSSPRKQFTPHIPSLTPKPQDLPLGKFPNSQKPVSAALTSASES